MFQTIEAQQMFTFHILGNKITSNFQFCRLHFLFNLNGTNKVFFYGQKNVVCYNSIIVYKDNTGIVFFFIVLNKITMFNKTWKYFVNFFPFLPFLQFRFTEPLLTYLLVCIFLLIRSVSLRKIIVNMQLTITNFKVNKYTLFNHYVL